MSASPGNGADSEQGNARPENLGPEYERARERAEDLLNTWGTRLGSFAATVGAELQRAAARAREEAEDIWAEAQEMRKENQNQAPPT